MADPVEPRGSPDPDVLDYLREQFARVNARLGDIASGIKNIKGGRRWDRGMHMTSDPDPMQDAAGNAAEAALPGQLLFVADAAAYDAFAAALDAPAKPNPKLATLLKRRAPWQAPKGK